MCAICLAWHVYYPITPLWPVAVCIIPLKHSPDKGERMSNSHPQDQRKKPAVSPDRRVLYPGRRREAVVSRDCCSEPRSSAPPHGKPPEEN